MEARFVGRTLMTSAKLQPRANKRDCISVLFDSERPLEQYKLILLFSVCHISGSHYNVPISLTRIPQSKVQFTWFSFSTWHFSLFCINNSFKLG